MDDAGFWDIIAVTGGSAAKPAMRRFRDHLMALPAGDVEAFSARLVAKVYALDTEAHYHQPVYSDELPSGETEPEDESGEEVDTDLFVSVRLAVVLAGPVVYAEVLADPTALSRHVWTQMGDAEQLVERLEKVYRKRDIGTGVMPDRLSMETGSNPRGFQDAEPAGPETASSEQFWLLGMHELKDPTLFPGAPRGKAWIRLEGPLDAALAQLAADPARRRAFADRGRRWVHVELTLRGPDKKQDIRVRPEVDAVFLEIRAHAGLIDPTPAEITAWAHRTYAGALEHAIERLDRSGVGSFTEAGTHQLTTARLTLRELTPDQVAALLDPDASSPGWITGYPLPGSRNAATGFGRRGPGDLRPGFGMYHLVRTSDGLVIGEMGFHQPPADGVVEVGFGLAEAARGAGYASEALAALVRWALTQPGVDQVVARALESNEPSRGVLTRSGFESVGRDGDFECFVRRAGARS